MKNYKIIYVILFALFFISCSEEEKKLEVYNAEAFAFQLEEEWELNATAQIKGFKQVEENQNYVAKLSYYTNLVTPSGDLLEEVDYGMIDKENGEELTDIQLEIQLVMDSSFTEGEYALQIIVNDDLTEQQATTEVKFNLSN